MTEQWVKANGVSLFTESVGNRNDPAILLVMGAMASGVWWPESFCGELARRGRFVIRYDHRDTGRSTSGPPGTTDYTVVDLADDIVRVLDGYGVREAHLVGMSLGGYLAQIVALKHPERVRTLTLIASERLASADPGMPGIDPELIAHHQSASTIDWNDPAAVIEYQVDAWRRLNGSAYPFDEELIRVLATEDLERTPNPLTAFNHASLGDAHGWVDRLDEIRAPALIIHGTEDNVLPYEHALALQRDLPNARLVTLEGTGHELPRGDWPRMLDEIEVHTRA